MELFIQIWAAGFYLLNKIFFAVAESRDSGIKRKLKLWGWGVYILGVPGWIIIFVMHRNWIAASTEAGGIPSMLLGFLSVYFHDRAPNRRLAFAAKACVYFFLAVGVCYSLADYGGITSVRQLLEISSMSAFLIGSYMLAKNDIRGWIFFMIMNASVALLLFIQDKPLIVIQQMVSLGFVVFGFLSAVRSKRRETAAP